jgi:hypothetical protein
MFKNFFSIFIVLFITGSIFYAQETQKLVNIHLVATHQNQVVKLKEQQFVQSFFSEADLKCNFDQYDVSDKSNPLIWNNPNLEKVAYSLQMTNCRDRFFNTSRPIASDDFYVFVVQRFMDTAIHYYAIKDKNILFIARESPNFEKNLCAALSLSIGEEMILDSTKTFELSEKCKEDLYLANSMFQRFDDFESISSNNGQVAQYFWTEDQNGNIVLQNHESIKSIFRPTKINDYALYLNLKNPLIKPIVLNQNWIISPLHILIFSILIYVLLLLRKRINSTIRESRWPKKWRLRLYKLLLWVLTSGAIFGSYVLIDVLYTSTFLSTATLDDFKGYSENSLVKEIEQNPAFLLIGAPSLQSQIFIKKNKVWTASKMKKVLYFDQKTQGNKVTLKFVSSTNYLTIGNKKRSAKTHYFVIRKWQNGKLLKVNVYNYAGLCIDDKLRHVDPARRILLFVNGYRPISLAANLNGYLKAIGKNGTEYPDSKNIIFNNDRFDYWTPWKKFNQRMIDQINPSEVFYADGHHSASTSNYASTEAFVYAQSSYPNPCENLKKHHCFQTKTATGKVIPTLSLLQRNPNKSGFYLRRKNGRIAGKNLLSILNELPNYSQNDTIFIVAHSMGYAYALGILDVIKKSVNGGGFYIFAAENAGSGKVNTSYWKEVWQYGVLINGKGKVAPCLQDGIAPQVITKGISADRHVNFPLSYSAKLGFSNSHFIGNYDWVFDLEKGQKGYITRQKN